MRTVDLNIIKLFIAIVLCFSSNSIFSQKTFKNEADLIKTADKLYENEEYEKAFEYYQTLLSNHKNNPDYNLRYGVCLLFSDRSDPERPIYYLKKAAEYKEIDNSVYYFLGLSYHVNYRFLEAKEMYQKFNEIAKNRNVEKYNVERRIQECNHGLNLFSNVQMLYVLNKIEVKADFYYRNYEMNKTNGRIIILPEELQSKYDEKNLKVKTAFYISKDRLIFYASYGKKGDSGLDIYRAKQNLDGEWDDIEKLDNNINTEFDDAHPFVTENGKTLYFSSKGHNTIGGYDIFKSDFNMSSFSYSVPENMNFPINTPYDDIFFAPDTSNKYAYFSSNRNSRSNLIQVYKIGLNKRPPEINNLAQALSKEESMIFEAKKIRELSKLQRNIDDYKYDNEIAQNEGFYNDTNLITKEKTDSKQISASDFDGLSRTQVLDTAFDRYKALKYKTIELKKNKQIIANIANKYKLKAKNAIQSDAENAQEDFVKYSSNASIADDISNDLEDYINKSESSSKEIMVLISKIQQNIDLNPNETAQIVVKIDSIYNDAYPGKKVFEDVIKQKEKLLALEEKEALKNKSTFDNYSKEIADLQQEVKEYKDVLKNLSNEEDIKEYKEIIELVENKKSILEKKNQDISKNIAQNEHNIDSLKVINSGAAELKKEIDNQSISVNTKTGSGIDESVKREIIQDIYNKKKSTEGAEIQIAESDKDSSDVKDEDNVIISESYDIQEKKQKEETLAKIDEFKNQIEITQNQLNENLDSAKNISNSAYNYAENLIQKSKNNENQIALLEDSLKNNPKIQNEEKQVIIENIKDLIKEKSKYDKNIEYSNKIAEEYENQYTQLSNKSNEIEILKESLDTLDSSVSKEDLDQFGKNISEISDNSKLNLKNKISEDNKELITEIESNYTTQKSENKDFIKSYIAENKSSDKEENIVEEWETAFNEELNQIAEAEAEKDSIAQIAEVNKIQSQKITELEAQLNNTLAIVNDNIDSASNMSSTAYSIAQNLITESDFREKEISQIENALKENPNLPESQINEIVDNIKTLKNQNIDAQSKIKKLNEIATEYDSKAELLTEKAIEINILKDSLSEYSGQTSEYSLNLLKEKIDSTTSNNQQIEFESSPEKTELLAEVKESYSTESINIEENKNTIESFIAENNNPKSKETQIQEWETQFKTEINQILEEKSQTDTSEIIAQTNEANLAENQITEDTNSINNQSETELAEQNNLQSDSTNQQVNLAENQITEDTNFINNQSETELAEQNNLQSDSTNQQVNLAENQIPEDTSFINNQSETELAEQNNLQSDSTNQQANLAENQIPEDTNFINNQSETELAEQNNLQSDTANQQDNLAENQIPEDTSFINNQSKTELAEQNNLQSDSTNQQVNLAENQITEDTNFINNQSETELAEQNNLQSDSANQQTEEELAIAENDEAKVIIDNNGNISVTEYQDERKKQLAESYIKPKVELANNLNNKNKELSEKLEITEQRVEEYKIKAQQKHDNAKLAYQNYLSSDNENIKDSLAKVISKSELEAQSLSNQAEIAEEIYEIHKAELSSVNENKNSLIKIIEETNNEIASGKTEISDIDFEENIVSSKELLETKESELIAENNRLETEIQDLESDIERLEINQEETEIEADKLLVKADGINNPNRKAKVSEQAEQTYQKLNKIENDIALNQDKKQELQSQIDLNNSYIESLNQEFNADNSSEITMNFNLKQSDIQAEGSPILAKLDSIAQAENKNTASAKRLSELDLLYIKKGIISKTNKVNQAKLDIFENKLDNEEIEFNLRTTLENNIASLNTKIDSLNDIEFNLNSKINQLESQGFTSEYANEFASVDLVYSNLNQQASELNSEADSLDEIAEVMSRKERKQIIQKADANRIQAFNMEVMAEEFSDLYLENEYTENELIIEEFYLKSSEDISLKKANEIIENSVKNHNRSKESLIAAANPKLSKSEKRNLYNQAVKLKEISVNQQQQAIEYYSDVNPNLAYSSEEMRLIEKPDSAIAISEESSVIAENNQLNIDESETSETENITETEDSLSQQNQAESAENVSLNESTEGGIEQSEQLNQQEINEESGSENQNQQTQLLVEISTVDQVDELEVDEVLSFDLSTTTNQEIIRKVKIRKADYIGIVVDNEQASKEEFYNEANPIEIKDVDFSGLIYKVQIAALKRVVSGKEFPGIKPLSIEDIANSAYKRYMAGLFTDYNEAVLARNQIRTMGYRDAFVVPYFNGERITNARARNLIAQGVAYTDENIKEIAEKANKPTYKTAENQTQITTQEEVNDIQDLSPDLFYSVQIGVYSSPRTSQRLNNLPALFFDRTTNNYYRYFSGVFENIDAAREHIQIARNRGFNDAFVVAFYNNQKVSTSQARNLENQGVNTIKPENSTQESQEQTSEPVQEERPQEENTESQIGTQEVEVLKPNESSTEINSESTNIIFKVQIGAYQNEIPIDVVNQFLEIQSTIEKNTTETGLTIYRTGNFTNYEQANELKNQIVAMGITDAFVVALRNGERISIQQALELIGE